MTTAEFERILVKAILDGVVNIAGNVILHRYTYKGHR
jgi:hypothetical protein